MKTIDKELLLKVVTGVVISSLALAVLVDVLKNGSKML